MGLLDQVLGQVIGNMAGGQGGRSPGNAPGGGLGDILGQVLRGGRGGGSAPGGGIGDILGQVLGGGRGGAASDARPRGGSGGGLGDLLGGAGGKLSPLLLAVLAILANKHMSSGAGGLGSILHDMLGGGRSEPAPQANGRRGSDDEEGEEGYGEPPPRSGAPYSPQTHGGGRSRADGGFLDDVGSMLDGPGGRAQASGSGDALGGDFDDLRHRFDQSGQGGLMESWIGGGPNKEPAPGDLERALGPETIDGLSRRFGIDRDELLSGLSRALPQVVDGLTPEGRAPTRDEQSRWV